MKPSNTPITPAYLAPIAALSLLFVPSLTHAQQACGEATCDLGYTCETAPGACPLILCVEGEECPPCEPEEQQYCAPAACETDADCSEYMLCNTYETRNCPEVTPECTAEDTEQQCTDKWAAWEAQCVPAEAKECTPRWYLPCEAANDCGAGFDCVQAEVCSTEGSSGSGAASSGGSADSGENAPADRVPAAVDPVAPEEPSVTCQLSEERYCQAIEQACDSDADCTPHWTCQENFDGACSVDSEGNTTCEPADPAKLCQPPEPQGYAVLAASGGLAPEATQTGGPINEAGNTEDLGGDNGAALEGDVGAPSEAEPAPVPLTSDPTSQANSSSGCALQAPASKSGGAAWALLLGALGLVYKRRSRALSAR